MRTPVANRLTGHPAVLAGLAAVLGGAVAAYILVNGSTKLVLFIPGLALVALGLFQPQVIFWLLLGITVCFSGTEYGYGTQSVFQPGAFILDPFRFNISQILIMVMVVVLLARWLLGVRAVRLPKLVWVPAAVFLCVYLFQLARALTAGVAYNEVIDPFNGVFVVFGIAAFWCFTQILDTPRKRLRMLDVLFVMATGRAVYALFNYFLGSGDTANAYRDTGIKVAIWETADHTLFTLLIVIALAGWATHRLSGAATPGPAGSPARGPARARRALWLTGSGIMALTVLLSFRRTSWFGLAAAIALTAVLIAPRSRRAAALGPLVLAFGAGIVLFARQRFSGSGSLLSRIFSDFVVSNGPTRQQEWALAWHTITRNPLAGDIAARRAGSSFAFWDTRIVHSSILYAWMKFGLLGMLSLALVPVACGWYAWRAVRARCGEEHIAFGLIGLAPFILFYTVMAVPLIEIRTLLIFALAGALGVLAWVQRDGEPEALPGAESDV